MSVREYVEYEMNYFPSKANAWYAERNRAIVTAYRNGEKVLHIATRLQLDVGTIRQILRGYGLTKTRGWW